MQVAPDIVRVAVMFNPPMFSCVRSRPKGTARNKVRVVSGGLDGTIRLWTVDGKAAAEPFKGHDGQVLSVAFSRDGEAASRAERSALDGVHR
jgi:WD40 repeat protein